VAQVSSRARSAAFGGYLFAEVGLVDLEEETGGHPLGTPLRVGLHLRDPKVVGLPVEVRLAAALLHHV
jgi:hypothetical protein